MPTTMSDVYEIVAGQKVFLTVMIGDADVGGSVVELDGDRILKGDVDNQDLGDGNGLKGKKLRIKTVVVDVNPHTNNTSVTYSLKGGARPKEWPLSEPVSNEGDAMKYDGEISFV